MAPLTYQERQALARAPRYGALLLIRANSRHGRAPVLAIPFDADGRLAPLEENTPWCISPGDRIELRGVPKDLAQIEDGDSVEQVAEHTWQNEGGNGSSR